MRQLKDFPSAITSIFLCLFVGVLLTLAIVAYAEYPGEGYIYLLFSVISNGLLWLGFRKKAIFFDTFIGIFFWLGFWLKLTIRVAFTDGKFIEQTGNFDGSGLAFDRALLVSSCGLFALIVVALIRARFFCYDDRVSSEIAQPGLFAFYQKYRYAILTVFVILFCGVAATNVIFEIYQRGQVPKTILPYGLAGIYKWLLQFGLASFGAMILHFEYIAGQKKSSLVWVLALLETFVSNVSLLSRGMILNASALFYGLFQNFKLTAIKIRFRFFAAIGLTFLLLFAGSVVSVNYLRYLGSMENVAKALSSDAGGSSRAVNQMGKSLFIDRWVGMEGVMAVTSSGKEGWDLWKKGWKETYSDKSTSFFDLNLVKSPYLDADVSIHHYVSLPGIIAFSFYPGLFSVLFGCMLLVGTLGALIDIVIYKLGGKNLILCSLLSQVVAYRFSSFGYVPTQSYLLFGSLFLNLMIIYTGEKLFSRAYRSTPIHNKKNN
jgi:hypothetical protein